MKKTLDELLNDVKSIEMGDDVRVKLLEDLSDSFEPSVQTGPFLFSAYGPDFLYNRPFCPSTLRCLLSGMHPYFHIKSARQNLLKDSVLL